MRYLFLLLISLNAHADCMNKIAQSEVADAIALKPGVGAKACGGADPCICFDGIDWRAAKISNGVLSNDAALLAAAQASDAAAASSSSTKAATNAATIATIRAKLAAHTATLADIVELLKAKEGL